MEGEANMFWVTITTNLGEKIYYSRVERYGFRSNTNIFEFERTIIKETDPVKGISKSFPSKIIVNMNAISAIEITGRDEQCVPLL